MKRYDLRLVSIDMQTVVSVGSPSVSMCSLLGKKLSMIVGCDTHSVLSCVSGVCTFDTRGIW